jgi:hypothetical protein
MNRIAKYYARLFLLAVAKEDTVAANYLYSESKRFLDMG